MTNKLKALLSPFRYTVSPGGLIAINKLLDKTKEYVIVPEGVSIIASDAFKDATNLQKLYLPSTLRYIGESVFYHCPKLKEIHLGSLESYLNVKFDSILSYPVKFYENGKLITSYTFPEGTKKIPDHIFAGMGSLTEVTIPEGVTEIGSYTFSYSGLKKLTLPSTLTTIGSYAFWSNPALKEVTIPEGVSELSYAVFGCCYSLEKITLHKNITAIETEALLCTAIREIDVPEGVTFIGENAFRECEQLTRVHLPKTLRSIGNYAFYHCTALKDLTVEAGLMYIGVNSIACCESLTELTLPRTVKEIGHAAFAGNKRLEKLYLPSSAATLGRDIVMNCPALHEVSTDGFVYVNNTLLPITPYEASMGAPDLTADDATYLAAMPFPKQIEAYRLKLLSIREVDGCEVGRSLLMKTLAQNKLDALIVMGGVIVGVTVDGVNVLAGESKLTYYGEDNNGAGTKGLREYATLLLTRMDSPAV